MMSVSDGFEHFSAVTDIIFYKIIRLQPLKTVFKMEAKNENNFSGIAIGIKEGDL